MTRSLPPKGDPCEVDDGDEVRPAPPFDVYLIMDGGKTGNAQQYVKPFSGFNKMVRNIMLHREEESLRTKMGKAQGVASL
eukprot:12883454-Prorocentrum_lima.AAC.1